MGIVSHKSVLDAGGDWLEQIVDRKSGAWGLYDLAPPRILTTAEALHALSFCTGHEQTIERGLQWLCSAVLNEMAPEFKCQYTRHFAMSAVALISHSARFPRAGQYNIASCIEVCTKWLLDAQNSDGGWGHAYFPATPETQERRYPSRTSSTAMVLRCLASAPDRSRYAQALQHGVIFLLTHRNKDGLWGIDQVSPSDPASTAFALGALKLTNTPYDRNDIQHGLSYLQNYQSNSTMAYVTYEDKVSGDLQFDFRHLWPAWAAMAIILWGGPLHDRSLWSLISDLVSLQHETGGFVEALGHRAEVWCTYAAMYAIHIFTLAFDPAVDVLDMVGARVRAETRAAQLEKMQEQAKAEREDVRETSLFLGTHNMWIRISWRLSMILLIALLLVAGACLVPYYDNATVRRLIFILIGSVCGIATHVTASQRLHWNAAETIGTSMAVFALIAGLPQLLP